MLLLVASSVCYHKMNYMEKTMFLHVILDIIFLQSTVDGRPQCSEDLPLVVGELLNFNDLSYIFDIFLV